MAAKMRLARAGAKKRPFYRVVVTDSRSPRDGRFLEQIGLYDPTQDPPMVKLDQGRVEHWLSVGVTPTRTVAQLIAKVQKDATPTAAASE